MAVWWCAIDRNYTSYNELKGRNVVAQGWSILGDISDLVGSTHEYMGTALPDRGVKPAEVSIFNNLLNQIKPGDLVVGTEGINVRGICLILPETAYLFDQCANMEALQHPTLAANSVNADHQFAGFDYTHCLYPVYWVDWRIVSEVWAPQTVAIPRGVARLNRAAREVEANWNNYVSTVCENPPWTGEWLTERLGRRNQLKRNLKMGEFDRVFEVLQQVILYGPPGTGKTYRAQEIAAHLLGLEATGPQFSSLRLGMTNGSNETGRWDLVQFHPSYNYEDFVRGVQSVPVPGGVNYEASNRTFAEMCLTAARAPTTPYVLIIDEINRGNLSAILGELLYGLEYRGHPVRTPYKVNGEASLIVPRNLYIIGTMNTADRSIGHLDYAVRRRFAFVQCPPNRDAIRQYYDDQVQRSKKVDALRDRALASFDTVARLFQKNERGSVLSPEYQQADVQVGHTYFMAETDQKLRIKLQYQVIPLLREYLADGILLPEAEGEINALGKLGN